MKKYKIIFYENGVQHSTTITAKNRREALQKSWKMFGANLVIGVEELKDED